MNALRVGGMREIIRKKRDLSSRKCGVIYCRQKQRKKKSISGAQRFIADSAFSLNYFEYFPAIDFRAMKTQPKGGKPC